MSVNLSGRLADRVVRTVLLVIGAVCLPYLWNYSQEVAFTAVRAADELAFMRVVEQLLDPTFSIQYFKNFNAFGYGAVWWAILAIVALPFKLFGSEQGMVVVIRLLSLVSSLVGFYLAYASVRAILNRRLVLFLAFLALIIACFFTQIVYINSTYIHPETMYCAFMMGAFEQLLKSDGRINRNYYWSIVWLVVAISIKMLAALFVVVYLVLWLIRSRSVDVRAAAKVAGLMAVTALALNPWVLHPDLVRDSLATIYLQSEVTRNGWPELHFTWTLSNSISYFSAWYGNIGMLIVTIVAALVTAGFLWGSRPTGPESRLPDCVFLMSFAVVVGYAVFCLFYTWQPMHYGMALLYFLPILVVSMFAILPVFGAADGASGCRWCSEVWASAAVILCTAALLSIQKDNLVSVFNIAFNPTGGQTQIARYGAIQKIRAVLERYPDAIELVGVAHDLSVPVVNGQRIPYWHLNALPVQQVGKSDILVFWKPDYAYAIKYMRQEPSDPEAFETYNRIRSGGRFGADAKTFVFKKFFEDDELEIYSRAATMTARSASMSRRHPAARAFDESTAPDDFWEAEGSFPHSIQAVYPTDQTVSRYQLLVGELATRMPRSWTLAGSRDGKTWVTLDKRTNEKPWTPSETRTYLLAAAVSYPMYEFNFMEGYEHNVLRIYEIKLQ